MSKKEVVLKRLADEWEKWEALELKSFNPSFGGYVFTIEEWNEETIYELEKTPTGSIKLSMTEAMPEDDEVWDLAAKVFGL